MSVKFSKQELDLIHSKDLCRIATISPNYFPHLVTVGYLYRNDIFYIPANGKSRKVKNIRANHKVTLLIDDEKSQSGIMVQSIAEIIPGYDILQLMKDLKGWINIPGESVVIKIMPLKKSSWFLKNYLG